MPKHARNGWVLLHVVSNTNVILFPVMETNLPNSFKSDDHSDFRTSIMIDIPERFLQQINLHRSPINRITYNVVSSTMASEYIRSMEGKEANCDSMVLISLCYGKQVAVSEARGREESA